MGSSIGKQKETTSNNEEVKTPPTQVDKEGNTDMHYTVFDGVEKFFDIEGVMKQELVKITNEISLSQPVKIDKDIGNNGEEFFISISHKGVVAVCCLQEDYVIKFTDLFADKQVEVKVENNTLVGFYDDRMILLTLEMPMREAEVDEVFEKPDLSIFKGTGNDASVVCYTDVSRLNKTRILYYLTVAAKMRSYNVDTKENTSVDVGTMVFFIASTMGIDCGADAVFQSFCQDTCILDKTGKVVQIRQKMEGPPLRNVFLSSHAPSDFNQAIFRYGEFLINKNDILDETGPIEFEPFCSVVRIYNDIFLLYDLKSNNWVLTRIIV